jgi:hypothetical protein
MIERKTLFILGAGASYPYGFPVGSDLRRYLCHDYSKEFIRTFKNNEYLNNPEKTELSRANQNMAIKLEADPESTIDEFISRNPDLADIARMAIIFTFITAERNSYLPGMVKKRGENPFTEKEWDSSQDWFSFLYKRMTRTLRRPDDFKKINDNNVSFITFNYERSLEYFW